MAAVSVLLLCLLQHHNVCPIYHEQWAPFILLEQALGRFMFGDAILEWYCAIRASSETRESSSSEHWQDIMACAISVTGSVGYGMTAMGDE